MEIGLKICVEKNEMIPEDRFEIQGDVEHGRTGAPTKARKNREAKVIYERLSHTVYLTHNSLEI